MGFVVQDRFRCFSPLGNVPTSTNGGLGFMVVEYWTVPEVASKLGLHPNTIRNRIRDEQLKVHRIGRSIRISSTDLEEFLSASAGRAA